MVRVPPRLIARSCTVVAIFSSARASAGRVFSLQYSFTLVVCNPGLRMATMHRLTFHCAPISLAAVSITASALLWR